MRSTNAAAGLAVAAGLVSCVDAYVYLGELPSQPNEVVLGKYVALDATSNDAVQVRVRAQGGMTATLNGKPSVDPLCFALIDGEIDTVIHVLPENVEGAVTAELVAAGDCATATPAGPAYVLVVRSGPGSGTSGAGGAGGAGGSSSSSSGGGGGGSSSTSSSSSGSGGGGGMAGGGGA